MVRHGARFWSVGLLALGATLLLHTAAWSQDTGGGTGGSTGSSNLGGVMIDAQGVLRTQSFTDPTGLLTKERKAAARASLSANVMKSSPLRKVSLNRLEKQVAQLLASGKPLTSDMLHLAGLQRITHVFFLPESHDVVVAGPAEGYFADLSGRVIGMESGQAVLQLQDLIVALRSFAPSENPTSLIACSIDPTQQGLQRLQQAINVAQANYRPGMEAQMVRVFRESLGMQDVTIVGVSPKTHFAQVLAEADYRMKLIGIGLEQPAVEIKTFIAAADPARVGRNALQRWYFQPDYECVQTSEDGQAMKLVGNGVKLVGEDERIDAEGNRKASGSSNRASRQFCESFTKHYERLANRTPVFGELRNLIDLSIAAAFIQEFHLYEKANWNLGCFADEAQTAVETFLPVQHVEAAINAVWKDGVFMTPIGGGVAIRPSLALAQEALQVDASGELNQAREGIDVSQLADDQWWWD